jgi:ornithine decarboxylase
MPKFILSKSKVMEQYNRVEQVSNIVSYSSKTNPLVTSILEQNTNCLFSIHMKNELKNVQDLSRVMFLAQGWSLEDIAGLIASGIRWFVVDNEVDLDTLILYLEDKDVKIKLLLRLRLKENTLRTEKYFVFGMTSNVINERVRELHSNPNIEQIGIHFHRKTQNMSEWNLQYEISNCIDEDVLKMISLINIGGGLPSHYANTNVDVIDVVVSRIKEFASWLGTKGIKMITEPGRFIAAPSGKLITKIVAIHGNNIIVDASVYNSDMDALIVAAKLLVEGELSKEEGEAYVIKGITPCSMDLFRYRVYLNFPRIGDEIVFLNAGAYNFTTEFCDLDTLHTEVVE